MELKCAFNFPLRQPGDAKLKSMCFLRNKRNVVRNVSGIKEMETEYPQTLNILLPVHYCILLPVLQSGNSGQNSKSRQNPTPV